MRVCLFLINLILSTFILNANNIKNSFLPTLEGEKKELSCTITFKENTLSICREKILLCDSSKLGVQSLRFFCELNNIDTVITDSNADKTFIAKLTELGINVL